MSDMNGAVPLRRCPVTRRSADQEDFEHDFTTPGKVSPLDCPFAKISHQNLPDTPQSQDPIAAEIHNDKASVNSPNAIGRCPIRFLDQHSPEEIAQYFENHKHEIPRSHEVCVKRYQKNENSIRQLDAKYGTLVSMIQGLGVKHKQYLPPAGDEEGDPQAEREAGSSHSAVEQWAERVSQTRNRSQTSSPHGSSDTDPPRMSHFEKPLREVRVGESPSRPWGISVPVQEQGDSSPSARRSGGVFARQREDQQSKSTPPVPVPLSGIAQTSPQLEPRHKDKRRSSSKGQTHVRDRTKAEIRKDGASRQIIFNGPVFFGYSAESAARMLRELNLASDSHPDGEVEG